MEVIVDEGRVSHFADGFTWITSLRDTQTVYKCSGLDTRLGVRGTVRGKPLRYTRTNASRNETEGVVDVELIQERNLSNFGIPKEEAGSWRQITMAEGVEFIEHTPVANIKALRKGSKNP